MLSISHTERLTENHSYQIMQNLHFVDAYDHFCAHHFDLPTACSFNLEIFSSVSKT